MQTTILPVEEAFQRGLEEGWFVPNTNDGLCHCGCGQKVPIAGKTSQRDGTVKGYPGRFVRGHKLRFTDIDTGLKEGWYLPNTNQGFCMCDCGQRTTIARKTSKVHGEICGQPRRFLHGHSGKIPIDVAIHEGWFLPNTNEGFCMCGCGNKTTIAAKTNRWVGMVAGESMRFCKGHKGIRLPEWFEPNLEGTCHCGCGVPTEIATSTSQRKNMFRGWPKDYFKKHGSRPTEEQGLAEGWYRPNENNGYCHCGCGEKTRLAPHTSRGWHIIAGKPRRFVDGHESRGVYNQQYGKTGEASAAWKGGRPQSSGYIVLSMPSYSNITRSGYILEHRWVMEQHLGRPLTSEEVVHHKNRDRGDNNIENLRLFSNQSLHMSTCHSTEANNHFAQFGWS